MRGAAAAALAAALLSAAPARAEDGAALAARVATAAGAERWKEARRVAFTWRHEAKGAERSYDWDLRSGVVKARIGGKLLAVPAAGGKLAPEAEAAHKAFVNDSYWLLFPLHLAWDAGVRFEDLGEREVPGFPDLGKRRALAVRYGKEGGYTPGDRYVLYLGEDLFPAAWAYHPRGAEAAAFVLRWREPRTLAGVAVPTRFENAAGEAFVTIRDAAIE